MAVACAALACDPHHNGGLSGRASDEWSRTYNLPAGAELQVVVGSGSIDVTAGDGQTVDVRAERVVHASSDAAARGFVSHIRIREDATPERILLQDQGLGDAFTGVKLEVHFHVSAPRSARLRLRALNGDVHVSGVEAPVVASTTSGQIVGSALGGSVDARVTSGSVTLDLAHVTDRVAVDVTDGPIDLAVPADARASITAQSTNGRVSVATLPIQPDEVSSGRRIRGRLNGGGAAIALTTTNGDIQIRSRP
jgi:hypothetical protein